MKSRHENAVRGVIGLSGAIIILLLIVLLGDRQSEAGFAVWLLSAAVISLVAYGLVNAIRNDEDK